MTRSGGFSRADIDPALDADRRVKALVRRVRDPLRTAATMYLFVLTYLESWRTGERVSLDDALPLWWADDAEDARADLIAVGLLDAESRVTEETWQDWYTPALQRRRDADLPRIVGGLVRTGMSHDDAVAEARRRVSDPALDLSSRPQLLPTSNRQAGRQATRPVLPAVSGARAREGDAGTGLGADPSPRTCTSCGEETSFPSRSLTGGRVLCRDCYVKEDQAS